MDPKNNVKADSPAALLDRAISLHQGGDVAGAIRHYRSFLAQRPGDLQASHLLGLALWQGGEQAEGLALVAAAAEKAPGSPSIQNNYGGLLKALGRYKEAEAAFRRALAAKADFADGWSNLAAVLIDLRRPADAVAAGRRATALVPSAAGAWANLGVALLECGRVGEAEQCQRRAIALAPDLAVAHANLGTLLRLDGQVQAAVACFETATKFDPGQPVARLNLGLDHLAHGRLAIGWDFYADRFRAGHRTPAAALPLPVWQGEPLAGRRLLIRPEQGLGDEIMFASAVPDLARLGGALILELDARLVPLAARARPDIQVVPAGQAVAADCQVAAGDLAGLLSRDLGGFTGQPWLKADADAVAAWRQRLAAFAPGQLRIGFCWRSGLLSAGRLDMYSRLQDWAPLFALPGICWVPLQYDLAEPATAAELARAGQRFATPEALGAPLDLRQDQDGVAALMGALDLVISAGTAVAELAGALGVPVWRFGSADDWTRLGAGVRPWYGSMRLFPSPPGAPASAAIPALVRALAGLRNGVEKVPAPPAAPPSLEDSVAAHRAGDLGRAEAGYRAVLAAEPGEVDAAHLLALVLLQDGRASEALGFVDQALAGDPDFANAHNSRGSILKTLGRLGEAAAAFRQSLALRPDQAEAWANLGATLTQLRRPADAIAALRRALALRPDYPRALASLATAWRAMGEPAAAVEASRQALALDPALADAWSDLGLGLAALGEPAEGLACQEKALAADPGHAEAAINLATLHASIGQPVAARAAVRRALAIRPADPRARYSLGLLQLAAGDPVAGWAGYAERFACGEVRGTPDLSLPLWQGEPLAGRRLLVQREQGLGDEIMFASLFGHLTRLDGPVTVEADPRLLSLLSRRWPGLRFVVVGRAEEQDLRVAAGSLPGLLAPDPATWDGAAFLAPRPDLASRWRERLAALPPGLRVGLCWRSQLYTGDRAGGYTMLTDWLPLFRLPGVQVVNLQYDDASQEIDQLARHHGVRPHGWDDLDMKNDQEGVAALMAGLDLVITAPTAVGELAGALGVPVWRLSERGDWSRLGTGVRPWFAAMNIATVPPRTAVAAQVPAMVARLAALMAGSAPDPEQSLRAGIARQSGGDPAGSMAHYRAVLAQQPDHPVALHLLGLAHHQQGQGEQGLPLIERAVALAPDYAAAWGNLGNLHQALNDPAAAEGALRQALALRPDSAESWTNLGNALRQQHRLAEAVAAHDRAVALQPDWPVGHANRATVFKEMERLGDAARDFQRALALGGDTALNFAGLADVRRQVGNLPEAADALHQAIRRVPGDAELWNQLGQLAQAMDDRPASMQHYDRALALDAGLDSARHNRGMLALHQGDLAKGWDGYAARYRANAVVQGRACDIPVWQGEPLAGRRLLVWGEQGLGDHLLFAALYPALAALDGQVILECDARLVGLFSRSFPWALVRAVQSGPMQADCQIAAGDLAGLLWQHLGDQPLLPYLRPEAARVSVWRERLAGLGPGLKVGLCWRSSRLTAARSSSYVSMAQMAPLAAVPGIILVNLQMGLEAVERVAGDSAGVRPHCFADLDLKDDLEGQAALIAGLDLVITAPTAVGEMAGALGTPVWRLIGPDWTSLGTGVRPWFNAMRLLHPQPARAVIAAASLLRRLSPGDQRQA